MLIYVLYTTKCGFPYFRKLYPHSTNKINLSHVYQGIILSKLFVFFLLIPSIPSTTLLNTVSEMLIQISPSIALSFLSYTPLEVLWALLGRAFRNLIRGGPTWSGDWARWPPEVPSNVNYSMVVLTLITQWVCMLQPSFHLLELEWT